MFKIFLADNQEMVRQAIKCVLERAGFKIVGEAFNDKMIERKVLETKADLIILDHAPPSLDSIEASRKIMRRSSRTRVIILTSAQTDDLLVLKALSAGIKGYVLKTQKPADLIRAINSVAGGNVYLSPLVSETVIDAYFSKNGGSPKELTQKQLQILKLIAEGKTTKKIARLIGVSSKTTETHRTVLMSKLGVHNVAALVRYAIRKEIIQP